MASHLVVAVAYLFAMTQLILNFDRPPKSYGYVDFAAICGGSDDCFHRLRVGGCCTDQDP